MTASSAPAASRRLWPLLALVAAAVLVLATGWHKVLTLETVGQNYEVLKDFIERHLAAALAVYAVLYVVVVALSLPGGLVMTLAGGLLFGWMTAAPVTVIAATLGATIVFLAARSSLGSRLTARAGPSLARLRQGFQDNAFSYLLFLRLVPAFPFFVVNLAPALLGVGLGTYVIATFLGIIPGTVAYAVAGAGLASVVERQNALFQECLSKSSAGSGPPCVYRIDTSQLVTGELVAAFVALGLVALLPVAIKAWSKRHAAA